MDYPSVLSLSQVTVIYLKFGFPNIPFMSVLPSEKSQPLHCMTGYQDSNSSDECQVMSISHWKKKNMPLLLFGTFGPFDKKLSLEHIDGLAQDCSNSSALAMELLQSCTKPWT